MSLVDYASSSDDDVPEPTSTEEERNKEEEPQPPKPSSPPRTKTKSGSSSDQQLENKPHSSPPSVEKLPDASLLLNAPTVSSNLMSTSDHFSRVAAAQAENASRKRDSNGMASSAVRSKVPRGNLPHSRNVTETAGGMLVPPQISGRKNIVTEDISKLFVKKHQ
ncbi:glycerol-3-phosphate dehydrogenase [NAD(+)] 1, cytosolic [Spatholobus suberectus]|nr:glycerol-3-phosphate dehydrogenase [NAD(+)] 1, cytosolic [Spatholobus suberectus]